LAKELRQLRFGSKADIARDRLNVRFTPKSGHQNWLVPPLDVPSEGVASGQPHVRSTPETAIFLPAVLARALDRPFISHDWRAASPNSFTWVRRNRPVHVEVLSQWPSTIQMFADGMVVDRGKVRRSPGEHVGIGR